VGVGMVLTSEAQLVDMTACSLTSPEAILLSRRHERHKSPRPSPDI